jgi:hypothetical protein
VQSKFIQYLKGNTRNKEINKALTRKEYSKLDNNIKRLGQFEYICTGRPANLSAYMRFTFLLKLAANVILDQTPFVKSVPS